VTDWRAVVRDADRTPSPAAARAPSAAPAPASADGARSSRGAVTTPAAATSAAPDLHQIVERWDEVVAAIRAAGKSVAATALEHATPAAVNARGDVTIAFEEANPIYEQAIDAIKADAVSLLRGWFPGVQRLVVRASERPGAPPARLTDEMVRSERIAALRKKDPVLDAAIDALDLDLAD